MKEDDLKPFVNIAKFLFILVAGVLMCKLIASKITSSYDLPRLQYNFNTNSWGLSR
jgi:hypothetical protein